MRGPVGEPLGDVRRLHFAEYIFGLHIVESVTLPATKDACKNGGWSGFSGRTFKNQGDCIQFVNTGK